MTLRLRLEEAVVEIDRLLSLAARISADAFAADWVLRNAAPEPIRSRFPKIPWTEIAGIGNVLRHDYRNVDPEQIWLVLTRDIVPLRCALLEILDILAGESENT